MLVRLSGTTLQDLLDMLSTVLECGFLIMQFLFQVGDFFFERCRLVRQTSTQRADRQSNEPYQYQYSLYSGVVDKHLANPLVDRVLFGQRAYLTRCKLVQPSIALFGVNLSLRLCDFLL